MNKSTVIKFMLIGAISALLMACSDDTSQNAKPKDSHPVLSTDINESDYEYTIKIGSRNVLRINDVMYYSYNKFLEVPVTKSNDSVWRQCRISGNKRYDMTNFSAVGAAKIGSKISLTLVNCNDHNNNVNSVYTLTYKQVEPELIGSTRYEFVDEIKFSGGDISSFDSSQTWLKSKYDFEVTVSAITSKLQGSSVFEARMVNNDTQPISLLLKPDSYQHVTGMGYFQYYTKSALQFSGGIVQSGVVIINGKNGSITLTIANGELDIYAKLDTGAPISKHVDNAHAYLFVD